MLRGMGRLQRYASVTTANYVVQINTSLINVDYLVVGGGGSGGGFGGGWSSGGGGAGGMLTGSSIISYNNSYAVIVGAGGAGGAGFNSGGVRGGDSYFGNLIISYGGGAGQMFSGSPDINGGSGGGILGATALGVPQTYGRGVYPGSTYIDGPRQGWDGSVGVGNIGSGGGYGGGGGGAGSAGSNSGGGGAGLSSSISGLSVTYSAGGSTATQAAGINPGDGGGSAGNGGGAGGAGRDGIVIISYSGGYKFTGGNISIGNNYSAITSGSLSFNGTSSYLITSANSLTSENFVMECFFYLSSNLTYQTREGGYSARLISTINAGGFEWNIGGTGTSNIPTGIGLATYGGGGPSFGISGLTISISTWHHIAVGRNGSDFSMWLDGIRIGTYTSSLNFIARDICIGGGSVSAGYEDWFPGYISNVRIVKGATLPYDIYKASLTVPIAPLTNVTGTYLLLSTTQTSPFVDSSSNNFSITNNNVTSSTQQPNFYIPATPTIHTFLGSGTLAALPSSIVTNYFIIAGGGGGGGANGGGGGAGGYMTGATTLDSKTTYTITVGSGGAGAANGYLGNGDSATGFPGTSSSITGGILSGLSTYGGGYGGSYSYYSNQVAPGNGGSGGGSAGTGGGQGQPHGRGVYPGSTYISANRQGYDGGDGIYNDINGASAGGGGAGAAGGNAGPSSPAGGGIGIISTITGVSTYYGGGGGGGGVVTAGGLGGGGSGGLYRPGVQSDNGSPGTANTGGGGGGGGGGHTTAGNGGQGGSGVVILSYTYPARFIGGTITSSGQNVIHTFTGSGSLIPI